MKGLHEKGRDFSDLQMIIHILPRHCCRFILLISSKVSQKRRETKQSYNHHWDFIMSGV